MASLQYTLLMMSSLLVLFAHAQNKDSEYELASFLSIQSKIYMQNIFT